MANILARRAQCVNPAFCSFYKSKCHRATVGNHLCNQRYYRHCFKMFATHESQIEKDEQLKNLCKTSKVAWDNAGCPSYGPLADEKKRTKKNVSQFVTSAQARHERSKIKERDRTFRGNHPLRFKSSSPKAECTKLVVDGQSVTDTTGILNAFRSFFGSLAWSEIPCTERNTALSEMEASSFGNNEQHLDTEISVEEIENALKTLKLGKSGGFDSLSPEHIVYGGEILKIWMKKFSTVFLHLRNFLTV